MSLTHCDACRREFKTKGGEVQRMLSSRSGRHYCPPSDEKACRAERRRLIRDRRIDLTADNAEVMAAIKRNA